MVKIFVSENNICWEKSVYEAVANRLPQALLEKAGKYRRWEDAQAFLMGRLLLGKGLAAQGVNGHEEIIQYNAYNRPYIAGANVDFNISHSGGFVVCALGSNCRVGVDIERIHDVNVHDFADCLTGEEWRRVNAQKESLPEFFRIWTIKEAVIKADGRGLQIPLKEIQSDEQIYMADTLWSIYPLHIAQGYKAHLAIDKRVETIEVHTISIFD
ncbi:4'-phosphopantetheinyl transferase family protein [Chryseolinea lacunae]|uniref:4'-phosphopantetheinyl transferase superfamily protein n=1 Tax=Chryseolinea lacunae TaxID=2801331 RepID=A0ABS1KQA6_9BACT|nr:4'-phosphopantetheinyl transferase superfamily protein [Chryseolinea lacunae]MBL0741373.1 4'-phosphopantetheinyl transferase superfamily protein [Chryseolinea lacunae]